MGDNVLSGSGPARRFGKALKGLFTGGAVDKKTGDQNAARSGRNRIVRRPAECDRSSVVINRDWIESGADLGIGSGRDQRRGHPAGKIARVLLRYSLVAEMKIERAAVNINGDSAVLRGSLANRPRISQTICIIGQGALALVRDGPGHRVGCRGEPGGEGLNKKDAPESPF